MDTIKNFLKSDHHALPFQAGVVMLWVFAFLISLALFQFGPRFRNLPDEEDVASSEEISEARSTLMYRVFNPLIAAVLAFGATSWNRKRQAKQATIQGWWGIVIAAANITLFILVVIGIWQAIVFDSYMQSGTALMNPRPRDLSLPAKVQALTDGWAYVITLALAAVALTKDQQSADQQAASATETSEVQPLNS